MYICPTCQRGFNVENNLIRHLASCWRKQHPDHVSKDAPRSEDRETVQISDDIMNFFDSFKE